MLDTLIRFTDLVVWYIRQWPPISSTNMSVVTHDNLRDETKKGPRKETRRKVKP